MQRTLGHCDSRRNPDDLRFTKGTINLNFPIPQLHFENIYDVLYALENKNLIPWDLPSLRVICHGGQLWTLDNKLLYICRISPKVKRVSVVHLSGQRFLENFLEENSIIAIEFMASAEFFPRVEDCDISPRAKLKSRENYDRSSTVKKLEKKKVRANRSSASKSSRTVTSQISSENTELGTPSFSVGWTCVKISDSKTCTNRRDASWTDSSGLSSEDSVETNTECYPAVRSMTGLHHSVDFLPISAEKEEHESACTRRKHFSCPSLFSDRRPSTSQISSRFSPNLERFPSAPRTSRLVKRNSSDAFTRLESRSAKTAQSHNPISTDRPSSAAFPDDCREHICHSLFANFRDNYREIISQRVPAKFLEKISLENLSKNYFSKFQDVNSRGANVSESISTKFQNNPREYISQGLSSKPNICKDETDDDFELKAFALPGFCSPPPKIGHSKCDEEEESSPFWSLHQPHGTVLTASRDRLDRSVSSCSSSTERPMSKPHHRFPNKSELRRKGGDTHGTFSILRRSNIGRSLSPLRRASVSTMNCLLSADHEFEVSKHVLLKHMRKAFFSVC